MTMWERARPRPIALNPIRAFVFDPHLDLLSRITTAQPGQPPAEIFLPAMTSLGSCRPHVPRSWHLQPDPQVPKPPTAALGLEPPPTSTNQSRLSSGNPTTAFRGPLLRSRKQLSLSTGGQDGTTTVARPPVDQPGQAKLIPRLEDRPGSDG